MILLAECLYSFNQISDFWSESIKLTDFAPSKYFHSTVLGTMVWGSVATIEVCVWQRKEKKKTIYFYFG